MPTANNTTAVILAGGLGTRLRQIITDKPKVLADINGRPFLQFLLDHLEQCGLRHVVLCTGYLGDQIEAHFGASYRSLKLEYSRETEPLGTGGSLRKAVSRLTGCPVLVLNGDSFCPFDFAQFLSFHTGRSAAVSLVITEVQDIARYGAVTLGVEGRILEFEEKGLRTGKGLINAGVYLITRDLLMSITPDRFVSLEREVFPPVIGSGLYGFSTQGNFIDIGVPTDYVAAQHFFS